MSFLETRINDVVGEILYDTAGGAAYQTAIAVNAGGYESRNIDWVASRGRWELGERVLKRSEMDALLNFFHAMQGRARGFRLKDWSDYQATAANGRLGTGAVGTGAPTYQLYKRYAQAGQSIDRIIKKPVAAGFESYRNAVAITGESLDTATGIVTLPALASAGITAITKANPGVVTTASAHGYSNGEKIYLSGVGGMTQVNNVVFTIAGASGSVFNLGVDTTNYGTYTSGGTAAKYAQPADALTWSGEFDVPVRFDADQLRTRFEALDKGSGEALHYLFSLPVVELRLA